VIKGLNHITLAVSDLDKSVFFYKKGLGFQVRYRWDDGAYLTCNGLWLCLSLDLTVKNETRKDYTHFAFDASKEEFDEIKYILQELKAPIWKENKSEGRSLYFLDPDGHKLELHIGTLETRLAALQQNNSLMGMDTHPAIKRLRELKPSFADMNIKRMRVFGSVVRGEAGPDSDIDLLVDFIKPPSWGGAGLKSELEEKLKNPVDLITESSLKHSAFRERILIEAKDV